MILVTGAAGKTGRAVIGALAARGASVRALVRRPEQTEALRSVGATQIVAGDMTDTAALARAMTGVRAVYHICPNMHPAEIGIGATVIEAAVRAGVEHFVYHSVLHPQAEAMPHHWQKLRVEELLLASGLSFTILQPTAYMENLLAYRARIMAEGVYAVPYAASARISLVALADVAAAAARVLTGPGHVGATYELAGTPPLSQHEVAAMLSAHLGRPVRAEAVEIETWAGQARAAGLSPYAIDALSRMFRYYDAHGLAGNANVLTWLLGRAPLALGGFLRLRFAV